MPLAFTNVLKNEKYGGARNREDRVQTAVSGHSPNNTHIHLDVRPVKLNRDEVTGYDV
jgi:hypothetical protein